MADRRTSLRIIDANLNRAREGLRVLEDSARFGLDDSGLSGELKDIRHGLRSAVCELMAAAGIERSDLLGARDTPGDVGTSQTTPGEGDRAGAGAVEAAAAGRAGEALRAIEESAKALGVSGAGFEALRYRLYEADKRLGLAMRTPRAPQWALCVLITESLCARPWEEVAAAAVEGGADCLQLREKGAGARTIVRRAQKLMEIAAGRAHVIVNDRADLAVAAGADGVHLGQGDLDPASARAVCGSRMLIGVSTANLDEARAAAGADYVGLGPVFPSGTKPKDGLSGLEYVRAFVGSQAGAERPMPHLAISGIGPENAGDVRAAGARGVAVSSAVCGAEDPAAAARAIVDRMRP